MVQIPEEKKLSTIRKYPLEVMIIMFIMALGWVTWQQKITDKKVDVNRDKFENYLRNDEGKLIEVIQKNTNAFDRQAYILERVFSNQFKKDEPIIK